MPGFRSDHINLIAANLRDRYKSGFPILKELIQNADDAGATGLVFGYHSGLKGLTQHPLLQGPALWVLNNGQFKESDKRSIQSFGLNSKAGESGAIGKFGLGMKSVFHLCEAFFYVAFDGRYPHGVILNPWFDSDHQDSFHNLWEKVTEEDYRHMHAIAAAHRTVEPGKSYLLLWVPLRMRQHVPEVNGKPYGAIIDKFPGDDPSQEMAFLHESTLPRRISSILPLLRNLASVEFAGNGIAPGFALQLKLEEGTQRIDHTSPAMVTAGAVQEQATRKNLIKFYVRQSAQPTAAPFSYLQQLPSWPKTMRQNENGTREQVPDKSEAEGAVMISHTDGDMAHLQLRWAVFLPTEEGIQTYESSLVSGRGRYQIVLHGQFFVDAGRRGIGGFRHLAEAMIEPRPDLDDADLHVAWNQAIAQRVVLPEVLPALADFVVKQGMKDDQIEELTGLILRAVSTEAGGSHGHFCSTFRDYLYSRHAWVCELQPAGRRWRLLDYDTHGMLLLLPLPPSHTKDPSLPWAVFPELKNISAAIYCDNTASTLAPRSTEWNEDRLLAVLQVDLETGLCKQSGLDYLTQFLTTAGKIYLETERIQVALIKLVQSGLRTKPLDTFRSLRSKFKELIALIRPERRVLLGTVNPAAVGAIDVQTFALLFNCDTQTLLLPADLDSAETRAAGKPSDKDIGAWLSAIDREIGRCQMDESPDRQEPVTRIPSLLKVASFILDLGSPRLEAKAQIVRLHRRARILTAINVGSGLEQAESLESLEDHHGIRRLFKQTAFQQNAQGRNALGHAAALSQVLKEDVVLLVSSDIAGFIQLDGYPEVPSAADGKAICAALGRPGEAVVLTSLDARRALLKMAGYDDKVDSDERRGLRYLLHGSPKGFMADQTKLWIDPGVVDSPWIKLWRNIEPGSWFVLTEGLANDVPRNAWEKLGISQVQQTEVLTRLQGDVDMSTIDGKLYTDAEREIVLAAVEDERVWRLLPLHIDSQGEITAIDANCYLEGTYAAPAQLVLGCRFVRRSTNRDHAVKQERWIPSWTRETTIRRALASKEPHNFWRLILGETAALSLIAPNTLPELRTVKWLPLANGGVISPEDVIDIAALANDIDRLSSQCDYPYAGLSGLLQDVKRHPEIGTLQSLFSTGTAGLSRLGQLMSAVPGYGIGGIGVLGDGESKAVATALATVTTLPAWSIIAKAIDAFDEIAITDHLIGVIAQPLDLADITSTLKALSREDHAPSSTLAFNVYLRQFAQHEAGSSAELRQLRLRSRAGSWQDATQLCVGAAGVVHEHVLDITQANILGGLIVDNSGPLGAETPEQQSPLDATFHHGKALETALEDYFRPWTDVMPTPPIGAFLCLLGPQLKKLGATWLEPHGISWFVDSLGWIDPGQEPDGTWRWMSRVSAQEALERLDPRIKVSAGSHVDVFTITGDVLSVELESSLDTIFAGAFSWRGGYAVDITLRTVPNLLDLAPQDLAQLLKRSASYLLDHAYNQKLANITPLWDELEKSDQLSLEVARGLILENLPFYLQQLKVAKRHPKLLAALSSLKRLQHEKSEAASTKHPSLPDLERSVSDAKAHLAQLMVVDSDVQRAILSGVRDRVLQSQYELSSIAFELFQNADDAVSEMQKLHADGGELHPISPPAIGRFVVEREDDVLRFIHWGRPINYTGPGRNANPAYRDDLENMLILSASDKDSAQPVTGKFGLGFKSVLLATDTPRIMSADLRATIIGGCLPERWTGPEVERALNVIDRHRSPDGPRLRPTVIELKVTESYKCDEILERFEALAGIQTVFSKEIRRIGIQGQTFEWQPLSLVENCPNIEIGVIRVPTKTGYAPTRLLVWRGRRGVIAMRLDSRGVVAFEANNARPLPSIWVTGPTRETPATGLILNADFDLDTGRGALAHGEGALVNQNLAIEIAKDFARDLRLVVKASRDHWEAAQGKLELACDVSAAAFWASFWLQAVPTNVDADASQSAALLYQFGTSLVEHYTALATELPNGMPGDLADFVSLEAISLVVGNRWFPSLPALRDWPDLAKAYPVPGWIDENLSKMLEAAKGLSYPVLTIELIRDCVPNLHCSPATAHALFFVTTNAHLFDRMQIVNSFKEFKFMAADGSWQPGASLLKDASSPEEALCHSFAPRESILHAEYANVARDFISEFGAKWIGFPIAIARWISAASTPQTKEAGLRYLLQGLMSFGVREQLRAQIVGTWLESIQLDSRELAPFMPDERMQLVAMLNPEVLESSTPPTRPAISTVQREAALNRIYLWWEAERDVYLPTYERHFWPEDIPRRFNDTQEDRQSWMTLFALGLMQRMGRTRDFQHRGFIDFTDSKGWWTTFCTIRPQDDANAWMNILKDYAEQKTADEKYIRWMDCFPTLYRLARWMEAYVHVFLSLDQRTPKEATSYLAPNEDPVLDGSDIYAPSLRNSLCLGQHLVIRELLRRGKLHSDTAKSLAYMPGSRIKTLLSQIGYQAPTNGIEIFKILSDALGNNADFLGDYDIPLIILSRDSELQVRLLNFLPDVGVGQYVGGETYMELDDETVS
jgi:hypothetical protein